MEQQLIENDFDGEIRVLDFPENIRRRWSIYIDGPSMMLREALDNSTDEFLSYPVPSNNLIYLNNKDFGGFNVIADRGRGIPIMMSKDRPNQVQCDVACSTMHAGSKFSSSSSAKALSGLNGVGISSTNALSEKFIVLSKITQENYDKSLPCVKTFYESLGPRSKKEIFYYAYYECGYKKAEGAAKKVDIEKMLGLPKQLPEGMSTIVLFKVDQTIFPNPKTELPIQNMELFLFIQEKFYKRNHIKVLANEQLISSSGFKTYKFEILKTITPSDPSENPYLGVYVTFQADPNLSPKSSDGSSVNGLLCSSGAHITAIEKSFEEAIRAEYKIGHRYVHNGLKFKVILLGEELVYDSQNKSRLKSISKVKQSDFAEITKEFQKIFRKNDDYWRPHVDKLNALAESYKSIGAVEKAQKMIDASKGNSSFRMKGQNYVEGFSDATTTDRWKAELFLCFTGETEMLTCNNERISMVDLVKRINNGEEICTFSCEPSGRIVPSKVIAAKEIHKVSEICKITLDNGESFRCTPDHKLMMRDGTYKEAKDLTPEDSMMPFYKDCVYRKLIIETEPETIGFIDSELSNRMVDSKMYHVVEVLKYEITNVEFIKVENEPVYCLEVDNPEHNFPLAAGIFAKNCEGLSAAGGLKSGRKNPQYHAILPLRGKVMSVKDSSIDEALANKEIFTMLSTIGLGVDINFVGSNCNTPEETYAEIQKYSRYGKIIIATD